MTRELVGGSSFAKCIVVYGGGVNILKQIRDVYVARDLRRTERRVSAWCLRAYFDKFDNSLIFWYFGTLGVRHATCDPVQSQVENRAQVSDGS